MLKKSASGPDPEWRIRSELGSIPLAYGPYRGSPSDIARIRSGNLRKIGLRTGSYCWLAALRALRTRCGEQLTLHHVPASLANRRGATEAHDLPGEVENFAVHGREVYWLCRKRMNESRSMGRPSKGLCVCQPP